MITGFNTDIEHDGVVYHVQTEDKGLDSPLILSLVYAGGAILASKRSRYEDLIAAGFDEEVLTQRLKRQHRLICAAINAGRIEDLKRMGAPVDVVATADDAAEIVAPVTQAAEVNEAADLAPTEAPDQTTAPEAGPDASEVEAGPPVSEVVAEDDTVEIIREGSAGEESAYTVYDPRRQSPLDEVTAPETGVALTMLNEGEFRAGEAHAIRILLEDRSGKKPKPLAGAAVSLRVLGTTFRPQIHSVKTERDGIATVVATLPRFTSGRAAILVRAVIKGQTVEVRRVIHPAA